MASCKKRLYDGESELTEQMTELHAWLHMFWIFACAEAHSQFIDPPAKPDAACFPRNHFCLN